MDCTTSYLSYDSTQAFSKIVIDYLNQSDSLKPFFEHTPTIDGISTSIVSRKKINTNRTLLVNTLRKQYSGLTISEKVNANIELLQQENVFTVTTAHQPNIFTGPLYFIYKIMHAVKLAEELTLQLPDNQFVPVYYMGSEDADLEELGNIHLGGQSLIWNTKQTGAVGRMRIDKSFLQMMYAIQGQIGVLPFGNELIQLFMSCYTEGKLIQEATLELVNHLFAAYGVVVLIPDQAELKAAFSSVIQKELLEQFSHTVVEKTAAALSLNYKVQASGRAINLFYLVDNYRERIELNAEGQFEIKALQKVFSKEEILQELALHPERFSPNVILRGVFQETILPNIAFIGGGGELAYWLELKNVFKAVNIPYPVIVLRNSFLVIEKAQKEKLAKLAFSELDLFTDSLELINRTVKASTLNKLSLGKELSALEAIYQQLRDLSGAIDTTLEDHVSSIKNKAIKKVEELEKKMLRAEKKKFQHSIQQITQLKSSLFPGNNLQERHDNFSIFYSKYGNHWLSIIHKASQGLKQAFGIIYID
jgi:bacillithiol biosynthesis cysteine-adding enzyme BshC